MFLAQQHYGLITLLLQGLLDSVGNSKVLVPHATGEYAHTAEQNANMYCLLAVHICYLLVTTVPEAL